MIGNLIAVLASGLLAVGVQIYFRWKDARDNRRAVLALVAEIVREVQRASVLLSRREQVPALTGYSKLKTMEEQLSLFPVHALGSADAALVVFQLRTQLRFLIKLLDGAHQEEMGWTPFQLSVGLVEGLLKKLVALFKMPDPLLRRAAG
jgi:hypothetical protein